LNLFITSDTLAILAADGTPRSFEVCGLGVGQCGMGGIETTIPRLVAIERSPYGEYFFQHIGDERVLFFHGGLGKVAAAASTQYVIDDFRPANLINIGTCGGVEEEYHGVYDQRTICGD
jgi:hypothetical protein